MRRAILVVTTAALFMGSIGALVPPLAQAFEQFPSSVAALPGSAAQCALTLPEVLASTPVLIETRVAKFGERFEPKTAASCSCLACVRGCQEYCEAADCLSITECFPGTPYCCTCSCTCPYD